MTESPEEPADATRRKLVEMEDRYRALFERSRDCVYVLDFSGRFLDANQASLDLLGYGREDIPRITLTALLPPEELPNALRAMSDAARTGSATGEFRLRRKDGSIVTVDIAASAVYVDGQPHSVQGIARDVTERKHAEEALRESEARYRLMVEQSISGFYVIEGGRFRYANRRTAQIHGYASGEEMIGRPVLDFVAERDRNRVDEDLRRRLAGEVDSVSHTFIGLRKDGSEVEIGAHGTRIGSNGRAAVMGLMQDISEARQAEREIQRHVTQLERAMRGTIATVTVMGELRDPYTRGHERRVGDIAAAIAAEMGLDTEAVEGVRIAGCLHDVGKIAVNASILQKPGPLDEAELEQIRVHPVAGARLIQDVADFQPALPYVLHHHERWDGTGYPHRLRGERIPLEARVLGVADAFDAMTSRRPYRPALSVEQALAELERCAGTQFDPSLARTFVQCWRCGAIAA